MHLSKAIRDERLKFSCIKEKLYGDRISKEKNAHDNQMKIQLSALEIFGLPKILGYDMNIVKVKIKYTRDIHNHLENWIDSNKYFSLMVSVIFAMQNITNSRVKTTRVLYVLRTDKTEG